MLWFGAGLDSGLDEIGGAEKNVVEAYALEDDGEEEGESRGEDGIEDDIEPEVGEAEGGEDGAEASSKESVNNINFKTISPTQIEYTRVENTDGRE